MPWYSAVDRCGCMTVNIVTRWLLCLFGSPALTGPGMFKPHKPHVCSQLASCMREFPPMLEDVTQTAHAHVMPVHLESCVHNRATGRSAVDTYSDTSTGAFPCICNYVVCSADRLVLGTHARCRGIALHCPECLGRSFQFEHRIVGAPIMQY